MSQQPTEIEKNNLESHVELCALRYGELERRLTGIEEKVGKLADAILDSKTSMTKVLVGTAGTVIAGLLSTVVIILMNHAK